MPWMDGISKEMIEKASGLKRLSHYQIIDHKLYRNSFEVFPFR